MTTAEELIDNTHGAELMPLDWCNINGQLDPCSFDEEDHFPEYVIDTTTGLLAASPYDDEAYVGEMLVNYFRMSINHPSTIRAVKETFIPNGTRAAIDEALASSSTPGWRVGNVDVVECITHRTHNQDTPRSDCIEDSAPARCRESIYPTYALNTAFHLAAAGDTAGTRWIVPCEEEQGLSRRISGWVLYETADGTLLDTCPWDDRSGVERLVSRLHG